MMRAPFRLSPIDRILVSASPGELRAAALREGEPWDLLIARDHRPNRTGSIHLARVRRIERALAAAFVELTDGEAFLPLRGAPPLHEGQAIVVQRVRETAADKLPEVSTRIAFTGRRLVLLPDRPGIAASRRIGDKAERARLQAMAKRLAAAGEGIIVRAGAAGCEEEMLHAEVEHLRGTVLAMQRLAAGAAAPALLHEDLPPLLRWLRDEVPAGEMDIVVDDGVTLSSLRAALRDLDPTLAARITRHTDGEALFEQFGIEAEIERAARGEAEPLPSGGRLWCERTRALTAIDVDTATALGHGRQAETLAATNLEAAGAAARLIRLRALSGLIVIDFAGAPAGREAEVIRAALAAAFADDPAQTRILPPSPLGLLEMSRERLRPSLLEQLGPEATALAALRAVLREARRRPAVTLPPAAASLLSGPLEAARAITERRLGQPLTIVTDAGLPPDGYRVEDAPL